MTFATRVIWGIIHVERRTQTILSGRLSQTIYSMTGQMEDGPCNKKSWGQSFFGKISSKAKYTMAIGNPGHFSANLSFFVIKIGNPEGRSRKNWFFTLSMHRRKSFIIIWVWAIVQRPIRAFGTCQICRKRQNGLRARSRRRRSLVRVLDVSHLLVMDY